MRELTHSGFFESPTVRLSRLFPESDVELFAKLDNLQMSGSTKERTAASLLGGLVDRGLLGVGGTVVESTSGNLGMALARQCALQGFNFIAVVDERANGAALGVIAAYGSSVDLVPTPADGNRLRARVERVAQLLGEIPGSVTTNQYANADNPGAHSKSTFPEICADLGYAPGRLYVATSTAGTILGCLRGVRELGVHTEVIAVDSEGSALFGGEVAERYLPGLGAGFETEISKETKPNRLHRIPEQYMITGARLLAQREGILAGASTGALVAAIASDLTAYGGSEESIAEQSLGMARRGNAVKSPQSWVLLVHDGGLPYLPTLYNDDWVAQRIPQWNAKDIDRSGTDAFVQLQLLRTSRHYEGILTHSYPFDHKALA